ncbi:STAS domain-containing protein [Streptomyces sp. NBC_01381]|uniref:STAS domain-containing protein n=1 Tax=Streptomyces sp. NBC_01381 TaxID=2903845 RepID=UPI00224E9C57|nr:STAS domain-containing protein [Streptomyces sp. NBC_01381]MCX4669469.1 STAS domain-containing protein [Streptomyces sp. NBC_01381]
MNPKTPPDLILTGTLDREATHRLCEEARELLRSADADAPGVLVCDVADLGPPVLAAIDALARLQLTARRAGGRIRLRNPAPHLRELLHLVGLPMEIEMGRCTEQREPPRRVQETVEARDPPLA